MKAFMKRNILLYFKDPGAVFFSVLSIVIIIMLYVVFLGDVWLSDMDQMNGARELMNSWVSAGIVAVTSVTTTLGAFGTMVNDRVRRTGRDFYASPLTRAAVTGGYLLGNYFIGLIMTALALAGCQVYIAFTGGAVLSFTSLCKTLAVIFVAGFSNTAFVCFLVSFFSSEKAFISASVVLGTLVGFLTGLYLPMGKLGVGVQWVIQLFPPSHGAALLRQILMEEEIRHWLGGAPEAVQQTFFHTMGIRFTFGHYTMNAGGHLLVLVCSGLLFYAFAAWNMRRKRDA